MRYQSFNPEADSNTLPGLIACYQEVFADKPWNEWRRCVVCGEQWGKHQGYQLKSLNFTHCNRPVEEFWPAEQVKNDLVRELAMPGASCQLALESGEVVGFCWGYPLEPGQADTHLGLGGISAALQSSKQTPSVVYLDDIGVIRRFRRLGIAKQLYHAWLQGYAHLGYSVVMLRTMSSPPSVAYHWFGQAGYKTIAQYHDAGGRVIMARQL